MGKMRPQATKILAPGAIEILATFLITAASLAVMAVIACPNVGPPLVVATRPCYFVIPPFTVIVGIADFAPGRLETGCHELKRDEMQQEQVEKKHATAQRCGRGGGHVCRSVRTLMRTICWMY